MDSPLDFESSNPSSILGKLSRISVFIFSFFCPNGEKLLFLAANDCECQKTTTWFAFFLD